VKARRGKGAAIAAICVTSLWAGTAAGPLQASPQAHESKPQAGKAIVGGTAADIADWPWQVAILRKNRLHCGGSVIGPTKILTAGHCALGFSVSGLTVVVGRTDVNDAATGESIPVASSAVHPDYTNNFRNDVAVLTLERPTSAPALGLPTVEQDTASTLPGTLLRVAGFGAINPRGHTLSPVLLQTVERVRTNKRCRKIYHSVFSGRSMICALGRHLTRYKRVKIHTTSCSGDSGGPLVADTPSGPVVLGTVSYGWLLCGYSRTPTVYARVSDALPFIQGVLSS
jgi:secreted trypsin-like serine protease